MHNEFEFASGGFTYKEIKEKYPKGLSDFAKGKKLDTLNSIQSKIENVEAQKFEWQTKLDKKLIVEKKKTLTKEKIKLQEQLDNFDIKTYSGIWKNDVTTADWANLNIEGKKKYYEGKFITETDPDKMKEFQDLYNQVKELDIEGKAYHDIKSQLAKVEKDLTNLKNGGIINKTNDAFSQERKDAALWFTDKNGGAKGADDVLRDKTGKVWRAASEDEKDAAYLYTHTYNPFNKPLRGIEYGTSQFVGIGNVDMENIGVSYRGYKKGEMLRNIDNLTSIIDKSELENDMWFQRGCQLQGMDKLFNVDSSFFNQTEDKLQELVDKEVTEYAFMSCGVAKGRGLNTSGGIVFNIYAPKGTKGLYLEPISAFGSGAGRNGDGISKQSSFGHEAEILLQRRTKMRVTKVEKSNNTIYVDVDIIEQNAEKGVY